MNHRFTEFLILVTLGLPGHQATALSPPSPPLWETYTAKPVSSMRLPSMPVYQPLTYQPFPVAPQGTYVNTYAFGNCTWYVAGRVKVPESWGNAADWAANAEAQGVTVSSTPIAGAIAQRTGGLGHVAIVLEFNATEVHITEMNSAGFNVVDDRWMPISTYNYIYI